MSLPAICRRPQRVAWSGHHNGTNPSPPLSFVLLLVLSPAAHAENIGPFGPPGAPASAFPKPDRPVAEIISPIWATEKERDAVQEAEQIIAGLGLKPGMSVADLGAGSGYHTVRLARALGSEGACSQRT